MFCGLAQGRLDQILTTMNRAGCPDRPEGDAHPTNKSWNSQQLWTELRLEHEAMTAQQKPRHSKSEQTRNDPVRTLRTETRRGRRKPPLVFF